MPGPRRPAHQSALACDLHQRGRPGSCGSGQATKRRLCRRFCAARSMLPAHSRIVAEADNELALIRHAKRALIDRTDIFGDFKTPPLIPTDPSKDPWLMSPAQERRFRLNKAKDPEQQEDAERSAAIKRVLSELTRLSLYEKRAAARRDRTIRKPMKIKQTQKTDNETKSKIQIYKNIIL